MIKTRLSYLWWYNRRQIIWSNALYHYSLHSMNDVRKKNSWRQRMTGCYSCCCCCYWRPSSHWS